MLSHYYQNKSSQSPLNGMAMMDLSKAFDTVDISNKSARVISHCLGEALQACSNWFSGIKLSLNVEKTALILFDSYSKLKSFGDLKLLPVLIIPVLHEMMLIIWHHSS